MNTNRLYFSIALIFASLGGLLAGCVRPVGVTGIVQTGSAPVSAASSTSPAASSPTAANEPDPGQVSTANGAPQPTATLDLSSLILPASMKGYELYSWQTDGEWNFTLITGTNRMKTFDEITSGVSEVRPDGWVKILVRGTQAVQQVLTRLPRDTEVFWGGIQWSDLPPSNAAYLTFPPQAILTAVEQTCQKSGVKLHTGTP